MRFRKKPVVINAVKLTWANWSEVCDFAEVGSLSDGKPEGCYWKLDGTNHLIEPDAPVENGEVLGLMIPTLEGLMTAREGDYIIRGVKGELYPCKPDIFAATYESIEPQAKEDAR